MKNLVYALVGAGFMIACQPSDQPEISGMLTGIESDTLLVQSVIVFITIEQPKLIRNIRV